MTYIAPGWRTLWWLPILVIAALAAFAFFTIDDSWTIDPDSAAYVGLARSIVQGEGYVFAGIPHTKYPPLFPLILAAAVRVRGFEDYRFLQCIVAAFWLVAVAFSFILFAGSGPGSARFRTQGIPKGPFTGLIIALLMAASIYMLQYSTAFLRTETVFTAFSLAAVHAGLRLVRPRAPSYPLIVLFVILFQCAFFTRMAGIVLPGALLLALAFDRETWVRRNTPWIKVLILALLCAAGPALWMARNERSASSDSTGYAAEFLQDYGLDLTKNRDLEMETIDLPGMVVRVAENTGVFSESCAKMLLNSNKGGARFFLKLAAGLLCLFGLSVSLVRRRSFVDYYCLLYLVLYLIWPFNQQQRFYLPLLPFLFEYAAISVLHFNRLLPYLLRQTGVWYLFIALQILLMGILFGGRSQQPEVLGRYSVQYFLFTSVVALVFLAADIYLLAERTRPGGLKWMVKSMRTGLAILYLTGFTLLGFYELAVVYPENHRRYLSNLEENPPPPALAKIEVHPEFIKLAAWIIENTDPGDVIMCDVPKMLHVMTGRRTVPFTFHGKQEKLAERVSGLRPNYVYYSGEIDWVYRIFKKACRNHEKVFSRVVDVGGGETMEPALYKIN